MKSFTINIKITESARSVRESIKGIGVMPGIPKVDIATAKAISATIERSRVLLGL